MTDYQIVEARSESLQTYQSTDWSQAAKSWAMNIKSDRTRTAYLNAWRDFLGFAQKSPVDVSQDDVIAYKGFLKTTPSPKTGKPFSQSTINQRLSALSSFFTFAKGRGLVVSNPVDGVNRETVTPYGKATWLDVNQDEDLKLLALPDVSTVQGKRDKAILCLFLNRGLRLSEIARLRVGDLIDAGASLKATIRRKGGKEEILALGQAASVAIRGYLSTRGDVSDDSPLWVATERGRKAAAAIGRYGDEEKPLTARAIRYLVDTYAKKLHGKDHRIHPHSLRHTAARRLDKEGASFRSVSKFMGHSSGQVTTVYLQSIASDADEAVGVLDGIYS